MTRRTAPRSAADKPEPTHEQAREIVARIEAGCPITTILRDYPSLAPEDVRDVVEGYLSRR